MIKTGTKTCALLFVLILTACAPSAAKVQEAINQMQAAWTPVPSQTPYPTYTPFPSQTPYPTYTPAQALVIPTPAGIAEQWSKVAGTWSGCGLAPQYGGGPYVAAACSEPSGGFQTLYLKPDCVIGEYCGNYVLGAFASEYIEYKLTLLEVHESWIVMHGDAQGYGENVWHAHVTITRVGDALQVDENMVGGQYSLLLPAGCDPVMTATTIGCSEKIP